MCIVLLLALATPTHAAITAKITYQTHAAFLAAQNPAPGLLVIRRSPANNDQDNAQAVAWPTFSADVTNQAVNLGSTAGWYSAVYNHNGSSQAMNCTTSPINYSQFQYLTDGQTIDITITCTMPPPTVASLSPTSGLAAGGTGITITGTNFTGATGVKFGANAASNVIVASPTQITATAPAGNGQVDVTVTTGSGTSATSASSKFTYVAAPTLTGVLPSAGSTGGGTSVTLTGTNLTGATAVKFDGTAATNVTVNSATEITATTPAHAAGAVNVVVTTPGGTATLTNGYTYRLPLSVTTSSTHVACKGGSNGTTTATATGGAPGYVYSWTNGATTKTIFGLIAGSYTVTVGDTDNVKVSATVTITQPSVITANHSFTNPTSGANGSASVSPSGGVVGYTYLWSSSAASQTTATATGLGAGTHTVTITDANGCTKQQSFTLDAPPVTAPGAPTIGTATAGDRQASVTFTAPVSNGGSAITTYTATANPGGAFGSCAGPAACTATVTGLNNGTAYTFSVTASNAIGTSAASGASNSATPKGNQTLNFPNPGAQNFGTTPDLSSTASATSSLTVAFTSSTTGVCTITSGGALTFVTAGSCTINADQAGNTAWNAATTVTQTFTVNAVVPGAPTIGTATAGDTQATVTFTAPASTGGSAISSYTVTANLGGITGTGSSSPITVTGLTNGISYTFTVTATNSAGEGSVSAASNAVTPASPQTITFGNPGTQNFGTTPTLTATSSSGGGYPVSFTSSTTGVCTITSSGALTFVTIGTCTINANQAGDSSYLAAPQVSQSFSVAAVAPGAPTAATATAGDNQASIAFTAPAFTGGADITGYTVTVNPADVAPVNGASSPIVVTGLTNGQPYTFTVTATNSAGTGAASSLSNAVMPAAPIAHAITATAQPSAGGSVTCTPSTVGEGGSATCTATANTGTGYVFQKWTGACAGQAAACNLTNVTAPQDSAALFVQEATGLVVPEGVKQGEALALTLQPSAANWVIQSASTRTVASTGTSAPSGVDLPHGLVNLKLTTGTAGSSATVVLTYPQALPAGAKYYKFGKTAANPTNHWYEFSGAVISGNTITLTIVDGGEGDNDLAANSAIDDPGGPAVVTAPPPPPPPPSLVQLQVTISGAGTVQRSVAGSVVSASGNTTTVEYVEGQSVTLTPQPQAGARFSGWSGACSGLLPCYLTLRSNQTVQATFTTAPSSCRSNVFSDYEERMLDAYLAYYGRPADVAGLAYWVAHLAGERGRLDTIVNAFGNSQEFQKRFGQMTKEQLIANLYQQMYAREPDAAGAAFFVTQLAAGQSSLASIAIHIFDGRQGSDSAVVDNRKKVVRHFVTRFEELGSAAPTVDDGHVLARLLSAVNGDEASALAGCARVDAFLDKATP